MFAGNKNTIDQTPSVIDLFAGVGGLSLGAFRAGFRVVVAVELDKHALASHKTNFPKTKHLQEDVSTLEAKFLLNCAGISSEKRLDGLIAGPPCQGFSTIGRRRLADPRNSLFEKVFGLIGSIKPRFFVVENVPGILSRQYESIRQRAFESVADFVLLAPLRLRATDFGAATTRERLFFIGYDPNHVKPLMESDFVGDPALGVTVKTALTGLPKRIFRTWITEQQGMRCVGPLPQTHFFKSISGSIPCDVGDPTAIECYRSRKLVSGCLGTRHSDSQSLRYGKLKPGEQDPLTKSVRLKADGFCPTLRAGTGSDKGSFQAVRPIHPTAPRVITPREAARLQGFPDWFQFAPSKWHSFRQIGNSVSPFVAEAVLNVLRKNLR
jgi:DNA (cytosine-5)-methyltransferase 1